MWEANAFIRQVSEDKAFIVLAVTTDVTQPITNGDMFVPVTISRTIMTGGQLNIQFQEYAKSTPEEFAKAHPTFTTSKGYSVGSLLQLPIWFCKRIQSLADKLGLSFR